MKKSVYKDVTDDWETWATHVDLACCDCGLVHEIETRVKDGKLQMRFARNDRATAQLRRHHDHPAKVRRSKKGTA